MKKLYQSPEVEVMNFAAAEKLAAFGLGLDEIGADVGASLPGDIEIL